MADLHSYTVIKPFSLPHCEEGEHEHFAPCPDCDEKGMQEVKDGLYRKCKTCGGSREGGPSLGMQPCQNQGGNYLPGQTVFLSKEKYKAYADNLAPAGATVEFELVAKVSK